MMSKIFAALCLCSLIGCNLESDNNAETALRVVQEFRPTGSAASIVDQVTVAGATERWTATKTNESLYRVSCKVNVAGIEKELVFGVNINKREVMALNRDALTYTNPS